MLRHWCVLLLLCTVACNSVLTLNCYKCDRDGECAVENCQTNDLCALVRGENSEGELEYHAFCGQPKLGISKDLSFLPETKHLKSVVCEKMCDTDKCNSPPNRKHVIRLKYTPWLIAIYDIIVFFNCLKMYFTNSLEE